MNHEKTRLLHSYEFVRQPNYIVYTNDGRVNVSAWVKSNFDDVVFITDAEVEKMSLVDLKKEINRRISQMGSPYKVYFNLN